MTTISGMADTLERTRPTLGRLCDDAGVELLDVALAPRGLDVPIADLLLFDPRDPPTGRIAAGDVVLAVGMAGADDVTSDLIRAAGAAGAAAVVCRGAAPPPSWVLATAQDADVALLRASADVAWGELYGLLQASIAAARSAPDAAGALPGGLTALADATASMAGGPVTIEDLHGRVLAFSDAGQGADASRAETVLSRRVPERVMDALRRTGVFERLMRTDAVIQSDLPGSTPRRVIAIRSGATVLGAIWLVENADVPTEAADAALREAAQMAAVTMMRDRARADVEQRVRSGMVRMLLDGEGRPEPTLDRLGLEADADVAVVAVAAADAAALPRLLDLVLIHLDAYRRSAVAAIDDARLYVLVTLEGEAGREALVRTLQDWVVRARRTLDGGLRVAVGQALPAANGIADSRRGADRALELAGADGRVVTLEEVHAGALLAELRDFLRNHPMALSPGLRVLMDYDREHRTELADTLSVYLSVQSDAGRAAALLRIHPNTLRYRVRRIAELTRVDLADPDSRLALEVQLRALA